jgi:hypothetical protein
MSATVQTVTLRGERHYGRKVPAKPLGELLRTLADAVRCAVRMAFESRSRAKGQRPAWLDAATDIRFLDHCGDDETVLHFETPRLGDAAPQLYEQKELWPSRPSPDDTGFDLLADVVADVAAENADSERFDRPLLRVLERFGHGFDHSFQRLELTGTRYRASNPCLVTPEIVAAAQKLSRETPRPETARIMGTLDMIRVSTNGFAIQLEGQEARGVLTNGDVGAFKELLGQDVVVVGKAVYRPSGKLLRIDAEAVAPAAEKDRFFARVPKPARPGYDLRTALREQQHKRGMSAIIGKWPGDETDEEIERALRELS